MYTVHVTMHWLFIIYPKCSLLSTYIEEFKRFKFTEKLIIKNIISGLFIILVHIVNVKAFGYQRYKNPSLTSI